MNIDEYLNNLQADLDNQLSQFGFGRSQTSGQQHEEGFGGFKFCPECGTKVDADARFCPNCGIRLEALEEEPEIVEDSSYENSDDEQVGVIFTDTQKLAEKYDCPQEEVVAVIESLRDQSREHGMEWYLLDASEYVEDTDEPFWLDYNEAISDFMQEYDLPRGVEIPVFIIGGDDVIPIPMVEDVFGSSDDRRIPCDMCYCFEGNFFSDLWDGGDRRITDDYVRNNVSRLPLEDGEMESSLADDLGDYFERCTQYCDEGLSVDAVMMEANASWLPASKTMSEHLPLVSHADDPDMVQDGMYVSPPVSVEDEDSMEPVINTLDECGMLLFNLHGAGSEGMSGFYNDGGEAFSTDMLNNTNAQILNTVACYGARYHGFERDDSMMLSALYNNGFLLYAGSLIPVPMTELNVPDGVEVHEGSGSEHLMPIYCMEQFRGLPVGEAMMRAKLEYFNTFRFMERDDFSMATMMMFSLYGNPMLRLQPKEEVLQRAAECHVLPVLPQNKRMAPIQKKRMQRVLVKDGLKGQSLLEEVQGLVDANLSAIHAQVQQHLYDALGLEPRWLDHVDSFELSDNKGFSQKGYCYTYVDRSKPFAQKSMVEVTTKGTVSRVFRTK
ncbi:MAG: zinc-ribbon domain-containing protein [Prevotellaceae bacterium]|nr:zinc-ribbon domain-containing protein [Prevotellaceae bacterium]